MAVTAGFIFRRPTGWLLSVRADDGELYSLTAVGPHASLGVTPQPGDSASTFVTAEVNIIGRPMDELVDTALVSLGRPSLRVEHIGDAGYIACNELALGTLWLSCRPDEPWIGLWIESPIRPPAPPG
ncbi:MAG: hypothetical protein WB761_19735, partial [Solirubrobacteraceae bacterium]